MGDHLDVRVWRLEFSFPLEALKAIDEIEQEGAPILISKSIKRPQTRTEEGQSGLLLMAAAIRSESHPSPISTKG